MPQTWSVPEYDGIHDLPADPAVTLANYLRTNWPPGGANTAGTADSELTPYNPPTTMGNIKFDTKFQNLLNAKHAIVVENMIQHLTPVVLGMNRVSHEDVKRIQVWATGTNPGNALDKRWKMEQQIESLVNANPLNVANTREVILGEFQEIAVWFDADISKGIVNAPYVARSYALCSMYYDKAR